MRIGCFLLISLFFCTSCADKRDHKGQIPLAEINGDFLYKEDLQAVLPEGLSKDDSLLFAEHYIRNWAEEVLLYDKAQSNIPDNEAIDKLVENYRKALIIHTYQQELIDQKLTKEIPEQELMKYYEDHKDLFKLDRPLIKGLFIKVPLTAPQLGNVRKWYKTEKQDAIDHLEKYSFQNAVKYDYFYDKWVKVDDVLDLIPVAGANINREGNVELKDSAFYYFLNVSDYRKAGEEEPYEFAMPKVRDMLINLKQVAFMKTVKDDLYHQAVKRKKIINY